MNWRETARQPSSLPGQRWLFGAEPHSSRTDHDQSPPKSIERTWVDETGQRFFADFGYQVSGPSSDEPECPDLC